MNGFRYAQRTWTRLDLSLLIAATLLLMPVPVLLFAQHQWVTEEPGLNPELLADLAEQQAALRRLAPSTRPHLTANPAELEALRHWRGAGLPDIERFAGSVSHANEAGLHELVAPMAGHWQRLLKAVEQVLAAEQEILALRATANEADTVLGKLDTRLRRLLEWRSTQDQASGYAAPILRSLQETQGLTQSLEQLRTQGIAALSATAQFAAGTDRLAFNLSHLDEGDVATDIARPPGLQADPQALDALLAAAERSSENLVGLAEQLRPAAAALEQLNTTQATLADDLVELLQTYGESPGQEAASPPPLSWLALSCAAVALLALLWFVARLILRNRRPSAAESVGRDAEQGAILRLLDEIGGIAEGDLTVAATPGDDLTGAIADAFNQTVGELRKMVRWGAEAIRALAQSTTQIRELGTRLAATRESQSEGLASAEAALAKAREQIAEMGQRNAESAEVSARLVQVAKRGSESLRSALRDFDGATEQTRANTARLARLGNDVEKLGEVSARIDDLADQTDILAVNGAMQAANAGEAGRGLVGLIDEVRTLAGRTREGTKEIQDLLRGMAADTAEVANLVETNDGALQKGTQLVEETDEGLGEVETVADYLDGLMQTGAQANEALTAAIEAMQQQLLRLRASSAQLEDDAAQANAVVAALSQPVQELHRAVAGFRLADGGEPDSRA